MAKQTYRVVRTTVKTGCDLERELIKSNLSKGKAAALKASLEAKVDMADFDPHSITSYLMEPTA
jgi:hypothetical protein